MTGGGVERRARAADAATRAVARAVWSQSKLATYERLHALMPDRYPALAPAAAHADLAKLRAEARRKNEAWLRAVRRTYSSIRVTMAGKCQALSSRSRAAGRSPRARRQKATDEADGDPEPPGRRSAPPSEALTDAQSEQEADRLLAYLANLICESVVRDRAPSLRRLGDAATVLPEDAFAELEERAAIHESDAGMYLNTAERAALTSPVRARGRR